MTRKLALYLGVVILLVALPLAYFVITRYVVYQGDVTRVVERVMAMAGAGPLSPAAADVIVKLRRDEMPYAVSVALLSELAPSPVRMGTWHARGALWEALLPLRLSDEEMLALYSHYLPFEGGQGIAFGARTYFGKPAASLSAEEAIGLLVISARPAHNAPQVNPEAYRLNHERLLRQYRSGR